MTEATIRLTPLLPTRVAICNFPSVKQAVDCVIEVISGFFLAFNLAPAHVLPDQGVPAQCVELLDALSVHAVNDAGVRDWR